LRALTSGPRALSALGAKAGKAGEAVAGEILESITKNAAPTLAENAISKLGSDIFSRTVSKGAAGAAEGSLWALSYAVGERSLGDPDDAAEGLLASVGPAAIWGGVLGGALGGAGVLFGKATDRLAEKAASKMSELQSNAERSLVGWSQKELTKIAQDAERKARSAGESAEARCQCRTGRDSTNLWPSS